MGNSISGFSLVEILLALALSSLLISILGSIFFSLHQFQSSAQGRLEILERSELAVSYLRAALSQVDQFACERYISKKFKVDTREGLSFFEKPWALQVSDKSLIIRYWKPLLENINQTSTCFNILNGISLHELPNFVIHDCQHAEIFNVKRLSKSRFCLKQLPRFEYRNATLSRIETKTFFLKNSALYLSLNDQIPQKIIEGVVSWRFECWKAPLQKVWLGAHLQIESVKHQLIQEWFWIQSISGETVCFDP